MIRLSEFIEIDFKIYKKKSTKKCSNKNVYVQVFMFAEKRHMLNCKNLFTEDVQITEKYQKRKHNGII